MKAPLVAIVAYDTRFWEHLPRMFHNPDAINWFKDKPARTRRSRRSATARCRAATACSRCARSGLDCGAMSGFDNAKVDAAFFPDGRLKSNFLVNIGYGTRQGLAAAQPALHFRRSLPDHVSHGRAAKPESPSSPRPTGSRGYIDLLPGARVTDFMAEARDFIAVTECRGVGAAARRPPGRRGAVHQRQPRPHRDHPARPLLAQRSSPWSS